MPIEPGQRYRALTRDKEEDEEYGECVHPVGSIFTIKERSHIDTDGDMFWIVAWEGTAVDSQGRDVPAAGMWTIWSSSEITAEAERL